MKKTVIIATYFGELPYYHSLWEKSAWANPEINWLVFTDQKTSCKSQNIEYVNCDMDYINQLIAKKFDKDCFLKNFYKVCDFRIVFSTIFEDFISDFEYWGHCDMDIIWGNLKKFLNYNKEDTWSSDIISADHRWLCGPFCLYKNCDKTKNIYKGIPDFKEKLMSEKPQTLDEMDFDLKREEGRIKHNINWDDFKICSGVNLKGSNEKIYFQRYHTDRAPAHWVKGNLYVESWFRRVFIEGKKYDGFETETMFMHIRPYYHVDLKTDSIYRKDYYENVIAKKPSKNISAAERFELNSKKINKPKPTPNPVKKILQLRIPKSASTFLNDQLKDNYKQEELVVATLGSELVDSFYQPNYEQHKCYKKIIKDIEESEVSICIIRHPIERLLSALYHHEYTFQGRVERNQAKPTEFDYLNPEEKIKHVLKTGRLPTEIKELQSCMPEFYQKNFKILNKINVIFDQNNIDKGISVLKNNYNIIIENKIKDTYVTNKLIENKFKKSCKQERELLKQKYLKPLEELYQKDIESYDALKK